MGFNCLFVDIVYNAAHFNDYLKHSIMMNLLKPCIALLIFVLVLSSVYTLLSITMSLPAWLGLAVSVTGALLCTWLAWQLVSGTRINTFIAVTGGALMVSSLCFTVGFWGPMIFIKETNQAPLIGIFIAAPFGLIVGAIAGYIYAVKHKDKDPALERVDHAKQ